MEKQNRIFRNANFQTLFLLLGIVSLVITGCGGGGGGSGDDGTGDNGVDLVESKPDMVLQVIPGAVMLGQDTDTKDLIVKKYTSSGVEILVDDHEIEWLTSNSPALTVTPVHGDDTIATVTVNNQIVTGMITARLKAYPDISSPPVIVCRAKLHPEVKLVPDDDVVFPPPNLPESDDLSDFELDDIVQSNPEAEVWIGEFGEDEVADLFEITDAYDVRYPIVLRGDLPAVGQLLVASGGAPIAGRVVSAEKRGDFNLIQIEVIPPQDLFEELDFEISAEQLIEDGMLEPYDTSGWELEENGASGMMVQPTVDFSIGPFECKSLLPISPTFTQTPSGSNTYFGPIWDGALHISGFSIDSFWFKAGVKAKALFNPELRLTKGVSVQASCELKDEHRIKENIPISAGPIAVLLSPYVEGYVTLPFKVELSGGETSRYGMKLGFDYAIWTGASYTPSGGWQSMCETWDDCTRTDQQAELVWDEDTSGSQMTIQGDVGVYLAGDVGIQAGGFITNIMEKIPLLKKIFSRATEVIEEKGKLPILRLQLGPHAITRWHNASRTAFIESSESAANLVAKGDLSVKLDALHSYFQKALRLGGYRTIPLVEFELFHFSEPYRILSKETLTVNGQNASLPIQVDVGDTVSVTSTVERDFINLSLIELFISSYSMHEDFPYTGELWVDGQSIASLTPTNDYTLSGSFPMTQELCNQAQASGGELEVKLLAFNKMFSAIPTANYLGDFKITCHDNSGPYIYTGTGTYIYTWVNYDYNEINHECNLGSTEFRVELNENGFFDVDFVNNVHASIDFSGTEYTNENTNTTFGVNCDPIEPDPYDYWDDALWGTYADGILELNQYTDGAFSGTYSADKLSGEGCTVYRGGTDNHIIDKFYYKFENLERQ